MSDRRPEHAKPPPPPAWALFEQAIGQRRCVAAFYHGEQRLLCPHALGWKVGRAKVLVYQAERVTGPGATPAERQPWRSMFVDEIEDPVITDDSWRTADNYTPICNNIDELGNRREQQPLLFPPSVTVLTSRRDTLHKSSPTRRRTGENYSLVLFARLHQRQHASLKIRSTHQDEPSADTTDPKTFL